MANKIRVPEDGASICTCSKKLQYCDNSCRESEYVPSVLENLNICCRICDGPCQGADTHATTRESWKNQEPKRVIKACYQP